MLGALSKKKDEVIAALPSLPGTSTNGDGAATPPKKEKKPEKKYPKAFLFARLAVLLNAIAGVTIEAICFAWERQVQTHLWNGEGAYQLIAIIAFAFSLAIAFMTLVFIGCIRNVYVTVTNIVLDAIAMAFLLGCAVVNTIFVMQLNFSTTPQRKELCKGHVPAAQQEGKAPLPGAWRQLGFASEQDCFAFERKVSDLEWFGVGLCFIGTIVHFLNLVMGVSRLAMRRFADTLGGLNM